MAKKKVAKTRAAKKFRLTLPKTLKGDKSPRLAKRKVKKISPAQPQIEAKKVFKALAKTPGADRILKKIPGLAEFKLWLPVATFSVCQKTGTAKYLDIWDSDHFDGFTDMQRCLSDCRAWFSANGFTTWDSAQTKTGRINCYFKAPTSGNYVCNVQLQSHSGSAVVECLIDNFSFGPLPFSGTINQPHPAPLSAGFHHFRIRQMSGSFFFLNLTVWKV